jgi:hypothetical protein
MKVGTPTNKDVEMELDDFAAPFYRWDITVTQSWFDLKKKLQDRTGLSVSINYTTLYMGARDRISSENQQNAAGGIFDATIKWDFINRKKNKNVGSIILWTDWRHIYYGNVPPQFLNFETGSATLSATKFNKWNYRVLEFYYQQGLFDNRLGFAVGKIDMPDWFNFHGLLHPMLHFTDLAFSVSPTVSWSNPGMGVVVGGWLDNKRRFALLAGLNDVAGDDLSSSVFWDMGWHQWSNGKFLKMVEFQYTPERARWYFNRFSATYWHSDELMETHNSFFTTLSSHGFSLQGTWVIQDKYIPTFTFGLSDGKGANALSKLNISLMNGWYFKSHDLLGIGLNYTESSINGNSQFLTEGFYRFTLSKTTAITPVVKMVINPSLNQNVGILLYYGIRGRISM